MAEILITGIEMPKEGEVLYLAITSGGVVGRSEKALNYIPQNAKAQELPPHGDIIDRQEAIKRFTKLAEVYDLALKDCNLEKEVYPHYEALMRGKKAVMELAEKLIAECPIVLEASK